MSKELVKSTKKKVSIQVKKPNFFKVILVNDDFTTMEFVVKVLLLFFKMTKFKANSIVIKIHTEGSATCGLYPKDVAETLKNMVNNYSQQNEFPLKCLVRIN